MAKVNLRPMEVKDIASVHQVDQLSFALPWSERSFHFEINENPASRLWVAEVEDEAGQKQIAGLLVIWMILDEAHIGTFAVHPDFRRLHIGQSLLAKGLLEAQAEGATLSLLEVRRGNQGAQALYQRFGYKEVGLRPRYYHDNGEDALLLTLDPLNKDLLNQLLEPAEE